ncbi:MAG: DUF4330 domain-containing protein [Oscillospiraceae bacterium]|nr:DUF4330 domain-containing protein [Oscillospiraceae bacterium]
MKNWIDEKGRLFGKVSIIDLGIIFLVVLIALGAFVKFVVLDQTRLTTELSVRYTLQIHGIRDWTVNNIRVGDAVFSGITDVGTIVSVAAQPQETVLSGDGKIWRAYVPERYTLYVEIEATATVSEGRYLISRTVPMSVSNSPTWLTTKFAIFGGTITEIVLDE